MAYSHSPSMAAVVGNPKLPPSVMDRWLWGPMPSAEEEAHLVSELLGCQPLVSSLATKERVLSALSQAECAHFATHISWKLAALVLTPSTESTTTVATGSKSSLGNAYTIPESLRVQDDASDAESLSDCPPLQEFLLTAADLLELRLPLKLVVLGSYQESTSSRITADGAIGLTRAFLAAGAHCVLLALWPVPVAASKIFVHAFYTALLGGLKASAALSEAMRTVQSSQQFSHPSNWAGEEKWGDAPHGPSLTSPPPNMGDDAHQAVSAIGEDTMPSVALVGGITTWLRLSPAKALLSPAGAALAPFTCLYWSGFFFCSCRLHADWERREAEQPFLSDWPGPDRHSPASGAGT